MAQNNDTELVITDQGKIIELTDDEEIMILRLAHDFFAEFDRIPGHLTKRWAEALDAIAIVANSRLSRLGLISTEEPTDANV